MPRFFITEQQLDDGIVTLCGEDAHHIARSLRMAAGETVTLCDGRAEYECELVSFEDDRKVLARVISERPCETEPPFDVTLYQALPKGDKLDTIIQKAVECGACTIVPFESEHCIVRMRPDAEERKTERRSRIALEAA
ncbi:MAG: 16S rRNA (uracil(1498)-N(3))-methyltransferase, partial [Clostridia bacterium]|nr:16S rRNA (uracil(1498)-N(3))-methyltransferase [Clostridia bacterium]